MSADTQNAYLAGYETGGNWDGSNELETRVSGVLQTSAVELIARAEGLLGHAWLP